ncbi:ABC transporter ATP-binding protein [Microlunatus speluncae]|uniref:ABC transporter ATP-binding protein n=1 Tax=Microlunatus speluncae TaxID=2594267 RepID=UPI0012667F77|nr:ABC transporter ATP-binding protein [Microlunatus speluncae]
MPPLSLLRNARSRPDPVDQPARKRGRRLVAACLRPPAGTTLALLVAIAAATGLPVLAPQLTKRFVDEAIAGSALGPLLILAGGYLLLAVGGLAARTFTGWLANGWTWDGTNRLREQLTDHVLGLDLEEHSRSSPGELIERVDGDVMAIANFLVAFVMDVVVSVLLLIGVLVSVFLINTWLGVTLTGYCILVFAGMLAGQRIAVPAGRRSNEAIAVMLGGLEETFGGVEDIRANGAGGYLVRRFHRTAGAWIRAEAAEVRVGILVVAGISVAFAAGTALLLGLAASLVVGGAVTVGTAVLLVQYALLIRAPFERLTDQFRQVQGALASLDRITELLSRRSTLAVPARPASVPDTRPWDVRFEGVTFRYDAGDHPALRDVELTIAAGSTLGLVGRTGSGKTTIARLLLRLYDPISGVVRVGGVDLRDLDQAALRQHIGLVTQDVQLFSATIRDNLTLFRPAAEFRPVADDSRLRQVLHEVGLGAWLDDQPDGLDTLITGISAGESQLLAFARVLLADPAIVVLDEPSSRLDRATEQRIDTCVARLLTGRTGIVIAHRLASLARVDTIAVVADGRIVEHGDRAALASDPASRFARLIRLADGAPR